MKKILILSAFFASIAVIPAAAHAQLAVFNLKTTGKASVTAPAPQAQPTTPATTNSAAPTAVSGEENSTDDLSITDIQSQPLPIRRQLVAAQLGDILLKLNILSDKTKAAADRLAQNGIPTDDAMTDLSAATLTFAQAKLSIDALVSAANDPKNETATTLIVDGIPFKDGVIKAENLLRAGRQSIIDSLTSLKAAVNAAVVTTQ